MEYRKSKRSFNAPGHLHFLTYSCQDRLPLLTRDRACQWVVDSMEAVRNKFDLSILAYVIMPEHVHALLYPNQNDYRMDRILSALKRPVSVSAKRHLVETGQTKWLDRLTVSEGDKSTFRFWLSGGGFDQNITTSKSIPEIAKYIHENPVRRGLVASPVDYEWSSARYWDGIGPVPIKMDTLEG